MEALERKIIPAPEAGNDNEPLAPHTATFDAPSEAESSEIARRLTEEKEQEKAVLRDLEEKYRDSAEKKLPTAPLSEMPFKRGDAEWLAARYGVDPDRALTFDEIQDLKERIDLDLGSELYAGLSRRRSLWTRLKQPLERNQLMRVGETLDEVSKLMLHHAR